MARRKSTPQGNTNRFGNVRLWDDQGRPWDRCDDDLGIAQIEQILANQMIRVGVRADWGEPLRWLERDEIQPFYLSIKERLDPGYRRKRPRPYWACKWQSGDEFLIVFESD